MALLGNFDDSYTQTGKGTLTRWANGLSFVPGLLRIPVLGTSVGGVLGFADAIIESAQWLFRGKIGSAATVLAAGAVGSVVNAMEGSVFWWANVGSGITTGTSLGTHARALTETVIGGVTGALGSKPQVLRSYPAAIGSISNGMMPQGPGKFSSAVSAQRGQNANDAYARYMSGEGGVHVNELQSAYGRGA